MTVAAPNDKVKICWQRDGSCLWHANCTGHFKGSGVMRVERKEESRSLLKCLHCGVSAWATHGMQDGVVYSVDAEAVPALAAAPAATPTDGGEGES